MKKKCPQCGRTFDDLSFKSCPSCIETLIDVAERSELPKGRRREVFERDGYACQMCGASKKNGAEITLDHIIPLAAGIINGGTHELDNLQTLCKECNQNKADLIFKNKSQYDIELKQLKITILKKEIKENKEKLNDATDEKDIIEYSFIITRLEEQLPKLNKELTELKIKYQEEQARIRIENIKQEQQELLFKKLYVTLSPIEKLVLKEHYNLNNLSDEAMLKTICAEYSESEIFKVIENYETNLRQNLDTSLKSNMLPIISSELSISSNSKNTMINHIINNYTKSQINDLINKVNNELFNQYAVSFNNIEKTILKRHYSLGYVSDAKLVNYVIENDYSIDELKKIIKSSYKSIFQEYYTKLDEYQKYMVVVRFENHGNNLVDFLAINNFSSDKLREELTKTKIDLYNKTLNSLNYNKKSLIERYSINHSTDFNLIEYLYKNKFSHEKIDELLELSKKDLINYIHQNLSKHEMFLLDKTFETD